MALRVWLNRTFATNHHAVNMLKANPDNVPVHVIGTHIDANSPVLAACDESYSDPVHLPADDYVEHALAFCRTHDITIFWPTWHQEAIARERHRFAAAGVHVLSPSAEAVAMFEDKARTYTLAASLGVPVPDHHVVTTADTFIDAYTHLKDTGHQQVCFKPVRGVGAEGFRIVSNGSRTFASLAAKAGDHISYDETLLLLTQRPEFAPLLVMPFLAGGEVSVDNLALDGTILSAVPRFKRPGTRAVELLDDPTLVAHTAAFVAHYAMSYLTNVQFRFDDNDNPYLLEVNTRPSGGLFQSCMSGGNLPWAAAQVALYGADAHVPVPRFPVRLTTLSTAVEIVP